MSIEMVPRDKIYLPDIEGEIQLIYGPIGGGKNTFATEMILDDLASSRKVFATWPVRFDGIDQLHSFGKLLLGVFGLRSLYREIDTTNFEYIRLEDLMRSDFIERLAKMTDIVFYVDEAYAAQLFDSYRKTNVTVEARMAIYATRHMNRKFVIVAQRPNAIHVSSRALVNRFYKCTQPLPRLFAEAIFKIFRFRFFVRTEYQDMVEETVNEEEVYSTKWKFVGSKSRVFKAFDSKYMRQGRPVLYPPDIREYKVGYFDRWRLLFASLSRPHFSAARVFMLSFSQKIVTMFTGIGKRT